MLTASDIRNKEFPKAAMGGYKPMDVDVFLEEMATTVDLLAKENADSAKKLSVLAEKVEDYRKDEDNIHTALLSAQRMSDQLLRDARAKSQEMIEQAQQRADEIARASQQQSEETLRSAREKADELDRTSSNNARVMVSDATERTNRMLAAAADSVSRQQDLFNRLRSEVAAFRTGLLSSYREHLEVVNKIPNEVEASPSMAAQSAAQLADKPVSVEELPAESAEDSAKYTTREIQIDNVPADNPPPAPQDAAGGAAPQPPQHAAGFTTMDDEDEPPAGGHLKFGDDFEILADDKRSDEAAGYGYFRHSSNK